MPHRRRKGKGPLGGGSSGPTQGVGAAQDPVQETTMGSEDNDVDDDAMVDLYGEPTPGAIALNRARSIMVTAPNTS